MADFNGWDGRLHPMRVLGNSGVWEIFLPGVGPGARYKFEVVSQHGYVSLRADPFAFATEVPPHTASVVTQSRYQWQDEAWYASRETTDLLHAPVSIYECHLGSWRLVQDADGRWRPLTYREAAEALPGYLSDLGFTHVEFLPIAEHPFSGSWGYQVTGFYAPTARHGTPDDFRYLVNRLHQAGIGVLVNWVAGHFPKDDWALARFDGTALYEHADPRLGEHPDWGTLVFNYGRHEVRNFLLANALFWIEEFHIDGLRVDAVALDALPGLLRAKRANGSPTGSAAGKIWKPSTSSRNPTRWSTATIPRSCWSPRSPRPGRLSPAPPTWAGSVSGSNGIWGGCTTP